MNNKTLMRNVSSSLIALLACGLLSVGYANAQSAMPMTAGGNGSSAAVPVNVQDQLNALQNEIAQLKLKQAPQGKGNWYLRGSESSPLPEFVSNDGKSYVKIFGRFQLDGTLRQVPHAGKLPDGEGYSTDFSFRRIRLGIEGQFDKYWIYKFQYNFNGSTPSAGVKDAYLGYHGNIGGVYNIFLAGNQHVPFGFQTPSNFITFMNHSLPTAAFRPARETGLTGQSSQKHWNFWYGAFDGRNPGGSSTPYGGLSTFAASGDLAINLVNKPGRLIRIGNTLLYNEFSSQGVRFETTPDAHYYGARLISTPALLGARSDLIYSPNLAFQYNQLSVRGAYYIVKPEGRSDAYTRGLNSTSSRATFTGWYAQADFFLTGEVRPYDTKLGNYVGVHPLHPINDGGIGAFQIAGRLDSVNLNDRRYKVQGGRETNLSLAFNWYPTAFTRLDLDYVKVFKVDGGAYNGYSPSIGEMRLQFVF